MAEHRVSVLGSTLRRYEDPTKSRDPRIKAVVTGLQSLDIAPAPRAHFRAELRAQLVAVAPRIVAEGKTTEGRMADIVPRPAPARRRAAGTKRQPKRPGLRQRLREVPIARPLGIVAAVVTAFVLLLGGAVWMSQDSLPGDSLYGLKRASERFELSLDSNDTERAQDYLDFAATRVGEAKALVARNSALAGGSGVLAAGGLSAHTAGLIDDTLASSDSDVTTATRLLGGQAVKSGSANPLAQLTKWAPEQLKRLTQLAAAMPDSSLRARTESSTKLVRAAVTRAHTLRPKVKCSCLRSSGSDELGPVPCTKCETVATPSHKPKHGKSGSSRNPVTGTTRGSSNGGTSPGGSGAAQPSGAPTPGKSGGSSSKPGLNLPSLPLNLPSGSKSLPVTIGSCGIAINLGPLGLDILACPSPS